MEHGFIICNSS